MHFPFPRRESVIVFISTNILGRAPMRPGRRVTAFPNTAASFSVSSAGRMPRSKGILSVRLYLIVSLVLLVGLSPFSCGIFLLLEMCCRLRFCVSACFRRLRGYTVCVFSIFRRLWFAIGGGRGRGGVCRSSLSLLLFICISGYLVCTSLSEDMHVL